MNVYMPFTHAPLKRKLKQVPKKLCQSDRKSNLDKMKSCSEWHTGILLKKITM